MKQNRILQRSLCTMFLLLACFWLAACQTGSREPSAGGSSQPRPEKSEAASRVEATPEKPVEITVLLDYYYDSAGEGASKEAKELFGGIPGYGEAFTVKIQRLPFLDNIEGRNGQIEQLRMEMMQDKGPDIVITRNYSTVPGVQMDFSALFPIPQSAMKQRLFLPLDGYIANAQYMEWDKLLPKVMEAGKDGEGRQVLLPLVYSFRASLFESESGMDQQAFPMTRGQMLESEDPYIKGIASDGWCVFADALCGLVDYETEELNFTQQELLDLAKRLKTAREQGAIDCPGLVESGIEFGVPYRQIGGKESPDYVLIPSYHQEGGVTAYISVYAAINRSTQHPDQCFAILDWLLSKESQRTAGWNDLGLPVHINLGLHGESVRGWYLSDWNFAQFVSARDQIDKAVFRGPLYTEMLDLNDKVLRAESDAELEKLVHDSYARMRMILAES